MRESITVLTHATDVGTLLKFYTTDELAALLRIKPHTLRAAYSRDGSYYGLRPVKAPNRFLLWPAADVEQFVAGGTKGGAAC